MTSPLRDSLRSRLLEARRSRDTEVAAALRTAIAALENAEAVEAPIEKMAANSAHVAGAHVGLGAAEAQRQALDDDTERSIVRAEITELVEALPHYEAAGDHERADAARRAAEALAAVLEPASD